MHRIALFWWEKETCVAHSEHFPQEKKVRLSILERVFDITIYLAWLVWLIHITLYLHT